MIGRKKNVQVLVLRDVINFEQGISTIMDVIYETKGQFPTKFWNNKQIVSDLEF